MKLKKNIWLLICCIQILTGKSQNILNESTSLFRPGDIITKQELQYKTPGPTGKDVIWDFKELIHLGSEYTECFVGKIDSSLTCLGGDNGYKYKFSGDSLFCIGYQNPTLHIDYLLPELRQIYPTVYKDSIHTFYYGEGVYSQMLPITVYGEITHVADAEGTLLLPDGDSLKNVLRIRSTAHIGQQMSAFTSIYTNGDTSRYSIDSLLYRLQNNKVIWEVTTYKWYAPGYRYPLFETVQNKIIDSSGSRSHFNRSYYSPSVNQNYLSEDVSNQEIRTNLILQEERLRSKHASEKRKGIGNENQTYNYSIGANQMLHVNYLLVETSTVEFYLYSPNGAILWHKHLADLSSGTYTADHDLSPLIPGTYLLTILINGKPHTEKIQKNNR